MYREGLIIANEIGHNPILFEPPQLKLAHLFSEDVPNLDGVARVFTVNLSL